METGSSGFCSALHRHYMNGAKCSFVVLMLKQNKTKLFLL